MRTKSQALPRTHWATLGSEVQGLEFPASHLPWKPPCPKYPAGSLTPAFPSVWTMTLSLTQITLHAQLMAAVLSRLMEVGPKGPCPLISRGHTHIPLRISRKITGSEGGGSPPAPSVEAKGPLRCRENQGR